MLNKPRNLSASSACGSSSVPGFRAAYGFLAALLSPELTYRTVMVSFIFGCIPRNTL
jgi:hypothetical protein